MASFDGSVHDTFFAAAPVDAVRAHFTDLAAIAAATAGTERTEDLGDGSLHFVLQNQSHGPYQFQPDYVVRYRREGDDVVWDTPRGNMQNKGRAVFRARGAGTEVEVWQTITLDLPIPRLAVPMIRPVVNRLLVPGVRDWLDKMIASVSA